MSSYGVPLSKRTAPVASISASKALVNATAAAVNDADGNAITGCLVHGVVVYSASKVAADAQLSIYDDTTEKVTVLLADTADTLVSNVIAFPAPIPVATALKLKHSTATNTELTYKVLYTPY